MRLTEEDKELFRQACEWVKMKEKCSGGIGTLKEKTVHAILKYYMEPREQFHEIPCGNYVADILAEGEITEIQTAHFHLLRRKLEQYLNEYEVTVVYPIPERKWLYWLDPETGEISKPRLSPKKGTVYDCFRELYKIKVFLNHPRLHIRVVLMDLDEYRYLNGWSRDKKKGSVRADRYPREIKADWLFARPGDYKELVPKELGNYFTSSDFASILKIGRQTAQITLHVLKYMNVVSVAGKKGRSILYERR